MSFTWKEENMNIVVSLVGYETKVVTVYITNKDVSEIIILDDA